MVWCFWPSDDLDAEQLLAKEHVVAVVQQPLFVDFDERSILRPEVGQGYLTVGRDAHLRVLSRDERIVEKIHVVALAANALFGDADVELRFHLRAARAVKGRATWRLAFAENRTLAQGETDVLAGPTIER